MATDEQDWVDRVMTQGAWLPPDGFSDRVVVQVMAALPPRRVPFWTRENLRSAVSGFGYSMRGRLEGSVWVLLQYRDLIWRSG
jgi:hypothetical protein